MGRTEGFDQGLTRTGSCFQSFAVHVQEAGVETGGLVPCFAVGAQPGEGGGLDQGGGSGSGER